MNETVRVGPVGPIPAKIMLVGEAPGREEVERGAPFVGASGTELTRMLNEAGILRSECFLTNVCRVRPPGNDIDLWVSDRKTPPDPSFVPVNGKWVHPYVKEGLHELSKEIDTVKPNVIIALGGTALWGLCLTSGITKWRGSILPSRLGIHQCKVIPTYHPASILRQWSQRWISLVDLRRAREQCDTNILAPPVERFTIRPTFEEARRVLDTVRRVALASVPISVDIETWDGQITCIGLAWNETEAICIPFYCLERQDGYWTLEEEVSIVTLLRQILRSAKVIGQNFNYDSQYLARQWGCIPDVWMDTMVEHHVHFLGLPKALDFLSSLYLPDHVYWKDEGRGWDPREANEDIYWLYNCKDANRTWRIAQILLKVREQMALPRTEFGHPSEIEHSLIPLVLKAELRGIKVDDRTKRQLIIDLQEAVAARQAWLNAVVGRPLNVQSPKQLMEFFYDELGQTKIINRKTKKPTCDAEALLRIAKHNLSLAPICDIISEMRSLMNSSSVCMQPVDWDGRMRTTYVVGGTETLRFASKEDSFGFGTNLQNITIGDEAHDGYTPRFPLPNLRRLFVPDTGFTIGEFDLEQADARIVAADAGDEDLLRLFSDRTRDLHSENCEALFGRCRGRDDPNRQLAKTGVHLTNYGGTPPILAASLGLTIKEAEQFQSRWFSIHPAIREWHRRIMSELQSRRYVSNVFGYRRFYFDRIEGVLKEALAWIPQSTVAITVNLGIRAVDRDPELKAADVQFLLQVHDSAVFQWPTKLTSFVLPRIHRHMEVRVPYPTPLVIPAAVKTSEESWGACRKVKVNGTM